MALDKKANRPTEIKPNNEGSGAAWRTGEKTPVLSPGDPWLKSILPTYATDSPEGDVVMADGVSVLVKVNVADLPAANASPELPSHAMEVLLSNPTSAQPSELPGLLGAVVRLPSSLAVQAYQKLSSEVVPVLNSVIV